ncbi:MAG TPA: C45 family autoproteolytic acyltransferase/hydrolase [Devosia sp.]|nr:C45 family autoproteolytic acyltransferase/hydrolase [Devosia sp.]
MNFPTAEPIVATGSAYERGKTIAAAAGALKGAVGDRIRSAAEPAADELGWVEAQWQMQQKYLPEMCELMDGMAAGYGITTRQLFNRHVSYAIEDRRKAAERGPIEECSAFAVQTERGVLVSKNRDNPPELKPLQCLFLQSDPKWGGRRMLSIGSFGSSPAASSGINSDGLCMVDTSVRTVDVGLGVLRYYLMDAILFRCGNVAEALDLIRSMPHLGGGNLVLGDAEGHIAAIQLGHRKVAIEADPARGWVARTNHFIDPDLAADLVSGPGTEARADSESRVAYIESRLGGGVAGWSGADCRAVLSSTGGDGYAPICRETPTTLTLSGAVFDASGREMLQSHGRPSHGDWRRTAFV